MGNTKAQLVKKDGPIELLIGPEPHIASQATPWWMEYIVAVQSCVCVCV